MAGLVPSDIKLKIDLTNLNKVIGNLEADFVARVGILGDKNSRTDGGLSNSEVGAAHEFGSVSKGIPKRSFLRVPLKLKRKDLINGVAKVVKNNLTKPNGAMLTFKQLGLLGEGIVKKAFDTKGYGTWQPLSQSTIDAKGSSTILVDSAQLKRSITSRVDKDDSKI
jgi:phage gpG-like protein